MAAVLHRQKQPTHDLYGKQESLWLGRRSTSIVDLTFGPDGTLYVVEFDEASWLAVELGLPGAGGTVNACDQSSRTCTEVATGLPIPTAAAVDRDGTIYAAIHALGQAARS